MTRLATFVLVSGFTLHTVAQNPPKSADENIPGPDEVQRAIDEFNRLKQENASEENEVTVVLEPPAPVEATENTDADESSEESDTADDSDNATAKPILVNGKPPTESGVEEESPEVPDHAVEPETTLPVETEPKPNVRVQSIREGSGKIDPSKINIRSSFPVKPLTQTPAGWRLETNETAPVFTQEVEVQPGTFISLEVTPHVLVPDTDGANTFAIPEPGYEGERGYRQKDTVAAVLGESIDQLDRDAVKIGNVLSDLNHLLSSLPKPEAEEEKTDKP